MHTLFVQLQTLTGKLSFTNYDLSVENLELMIIDLRNLLLFGPLVDLAQTL